MSTIIPDREYTLQEIINEGIIPCVETHPVIYNLITKKDKVGKRLPVIKTNKTQIKPIVYSRPGAKIVGQYKVLGNEILKFLQFNQ